MNKMTLSVEGDKGDLIHHDDWDLENVLNGAPNAAYYAMRAITLIDEMSSDEDSSKDELIRHMEKVIKWQVEVIAFLRDLFGHKGAVSEHATSREIILLLSQPIANWERIEYLASICSNVFGRKEEK